MRRFLLGDWRCGVILSDALVTAAIAIAASGLPKREVSSWSLSQCFSLPKTCRDAGRIRLYGALAPRTLVRGKPGCGATFDLQSPGGVPPGEIPICTFDPALHIEQVAALAPEAEFYVEHGYLLLTVDGRFRGERFEADQVLVIAPDFEASNYRWRFGSPEEIIVRSHR